MALWVAILLGIVQGLTEFIPISSSGHLVAVPWAFGIDQPSLAFAVALHIGTLVGVVWALRPEVALVLRTLARWGQAEPTERLLVKLLAIALVPAGVIGLIGGDFFEANFERPVMVGFLLLVTGYLLTSTEHRIAIAELEPDRTEITTRDAGAIGIAQAFAILPGISRAGATIAAAVRLGLTRQAAARFSFLLSVPAIAGAGLISARDAIGEGLLTTNLGPTLAGTLAAAISGWWAVKWFLGVVGRTGLRPFGRYCYVAGLVVLLLATARA